MSSKEVLLFLVLCGFVPYIFAQDSLRSVDLYPAEVYDSLDAIQLKVDAVTLDGLSPNNYTVADAGDVLNSNSTVFVKNYGPGSVSVLSYRGGTAYHTKVYWEGLSVDDPMLGQQDLSLLPSSQMMSLRFYRGGSSLDLGTGGMGGILNIESEDSFRKGIQLRAGQSFGSFNTQSRQFSNAVGNGKLKFEQVLIHSSSDNDFEYVDYIDQKRVKKRENAAYERMQWMPKVSFRKGYNQLSLTYWHTLSDRQVPSAIGTPHGNAVQTDEWNRFLAAWSHRRKSISYTVVAGYFNDRLDYDHETASIVSRNRTRSFKARFTIDWHISTHWTFKNQFKYNYITAISSNYNSNPVREEIEEFQSISFHNNHLLVTAKFRYYGITDEDEYYLPAFRLNWFPLKIPERLRFYGGISQNVRYPTFNELFWQDLEVTGLQEEESISSEAGLAMTTNKSKSVYGSLRLAGFYNQFENLILWLPDQTGAWKPINQKNAENKGVEFDQSLYASIGKVKLDWNSGYGYTRSLIGNFNENKDDRKIQIYTPQHKVHAGLKLSLGGAFVGYRQVYTSKLYISTDNRSYLPSSSPADVYAGFRKEWGKLSWQLMLEARNILSENFQYVANMPMPSRHYLITLNISFIQIPKS